MVYGLWFMVYGMTDALGLMAIG